MASQRNLSWIRVLGIWTLVGVALMVMMYISLNGEADHYGLRDHLFAWTAQMYRAWLWALLTPAVFQLRREIRRRHSSWFVIVGLHLVAAVALLFWCNIVRIWVLDATFGWWDPKFYDIDRMTMVISPFTIADFYFYWLTVGAGALYDVDREKRLVEQHEEQLRTQLAQAAVAAPFPFQLPQRRVLAHARRGV